MRETTFDALTRPLSTSIGKVDFPSVFSEQTLWTPRSFKAATARTDQNGLGKVFQYDGASRALGAARRPLALFGLVNNSVPSPELIAGAPEAENFQYDAAQNLLRRSERKDEQEETVETPPDASGRNRPASIGGRPLEWDANGNLRQKDNLRFAYDWRNRLRKVTEVQTGQLVATYSYDIFNRRVCRRGSCSSSRTYKKSYFERKASQHYRRARSQSAWRYHFEPGSEKCENSMSTEGWFEFRYCDFYDAPRIILVQLPATSILLYSYFDEKSDEYSDYYEVFEIPKVSLEDLIRSWNHQNRRRLKMLGTVPVRGVRFDTTLRKRIDLGSVIKTLDSGREQMKAISGATLGATRVVSPGDILDPAIQPHIHGKSDGGDWSVNIDGSLHDAGSNTGELTSKQRKALKNADWGC